jgi:hypothetical protein
MSDNCRLGAQHSLTFGRYAIEMRRRACAPQVLCSLQSGNQCSQYAVCSTGECTTCACLGEVYGMRSYFEETRQVRLLARYPANPAPKRTFRLRPASDV